MAYKHRDPDEIRKEMTTVQREQDTVAIPKMENDAFTYSLANYPISKLRTQCAAAAVPFCKLAAAVLEDKTKLISADATSLLNPFTHLSIDPKYRLSAYFHYDGGYHSERIRSVVAATPSCTTVPKATLRPSFMGQQIELPAETFNPLAAIFCDGTPEGFLEAVLFDNYIASFTNKHPARPLLGKYLFSAPDITIENWDMYIQVDDWAPKACLGERRCTISCYLKLAYPTFPYTERIVQKRYRFSDFGYSNKQIGGPKPYGSLIDLYHRYSPGRSCCIFGEDTTSIADQKEEW